MTGVKSIFMVGVIVVEGLAFWPALAEKTRLYVRWPPVVFLRPESLREDHS
jgi:hypothetical protein